MKRKPYRLTAFLAAVSIHVIAAVYTEKFLLSRAEAWKPVFEEGQSSVSLTLVATRKTIPKPVPRIEETDFPEPDTEILEEQPPDHVDPIQLPDISPSIVLPLPTTSSKKPEPEIQPESRPDEKQVPDHWEIELDMDEEVAEDNDADMLMKGVEAFSAGITSIKPRYPLGSRLRGEEGRVVLKVDIDMTGKASDVEVHSTSGFTALDRSASDAVRKARFVTSGGGNRGGTVLLTFEFKLTD